MPTVFDKHTRNGRKFNITETGQKVYKSFIGQKNVDLGGGDFAPYVWDEPSQSIRYGNLECEFDVDGFQTIREYGSTETLIDDQRFELQYYREQGSKWRIVDLFQVGLTVDQQDDQCIITRNLSDDLGNTLDVEFLFGPFETVKNTFRLHVVDADQYRIRFQNSGIVGEVTEVPFNPIFQTPHSGVYKLIFENIKFQWLGEEIDIHNNYIIEDQAGGKKLDIFIGDFDLPAGGDVVISPDQWGPTTIATDADDCIETDDTTYADDSSGYIAVGKNSSTVVDAGFMWTVTDEDLPGATINVGTNLKIDIDQSEGGGCDAVLKIVDNDVPGNWGQANRPSQLAKHPDTVDWDVNAQGVATSPELNTFIQQRIDGDDVDDPFTSGDEIAIVWEDVASSESGLCYWTEGKGDLTIVFTPSVGVEDLEVNVHDCADIETCLI